MAGDIESIVRAIEEQDPEIGDMPIPDTYLAATLHKSDEQMFAGRASRDKDPRESLHIEQVPTPELAAGEALVAVMASSINYNTVWSSIFEPVSTFGFLDRYARTNPDATRHNRDYHVLGSDASGVVLQTGPGVHTWNPGDRVVAHCLSVELESPLGHNDTMMDPEHQPHLRWLLKRGFNMRDVNDRRGHRKEAPLHSAAKEVTQATVVFQNPRPFKMI